MVYDCINIAVYELTCVVALTSWLQSGLEDPVVKSFGAKIQSQTVYI